MALHRMSVSFMWFSTFASSQSTEDVRPTCHTAIQRQHAHAGGFCATFAHYFCTSIVAAVLHVPDHSRDRHGDGIDKHSRASEYLLQRLYMTHKKNETIAAMRT
mmetsp:Transcript_135196/g.263313  ORF Transcript_135196/g.263313 Transcript_135196/m.263313 type:complete len:104 (+) Transcript_135196:518-829(+)